VRERKAEMPCGNRSAEAEHFFDEHNALCGHYKQMLVNPKYIIPYSDMDYIGVIGFLSMIIINLNWIQYNTGASMKAIA